MMEECDFSTVKPSLQERFDELIAGGTNAIANLLPLLKIDSMFHRNQRQRWRVFLSRSRLPKRRFLFSELQELAELEKVH